MPDLARPADQRAALFYRWPEPEVAVGTQLVCGEGEQVVLSSAGRVLVVLATGSHSLEPAAIPALHSAGGGAKLSLDVLFVTTDQAPMRFGAKLPKVRDSATSLTFEPRAFGTANLKVADAHLFASQLQPGSSADDVLAHFKTALNAAVADAIGASRATLTALASPTGAQLVADIVVGANPLGGMGVAIDSFELFSITVDEETLRAAMQLRPKGAPDSVPSPAPAPSTRRVSPVPTPVVLPAAAASPGPDKVRCPVCGERVPPGRFCLACGKPLSGKTHCTCGVALKPGAKFCSNCGARA